MMQKVLKFNMSIHKKLEILDDFISNVSAGDLLIDVDEAVLIITDVKVHELQSNKSCDVSGLMVYHAVKSCCFDTWIINTVKKQTKNLEQVINDLVWVKNSDVR